MHPGSIGVSSSVPSGTPRPGHVKDLFNPFFLFSPSLSSSPRTCIRSEAFSLTLLQGSLQTLVCVLSLVCFWQIALSFLDHWLLPPSLPNRPSFV